MEYPGPLADERCSRAELDFLTSTDVGRRVPAEEDAGSEASEWELRERRERGEEREAEAGELGAAGELCAWKELPLFLPAPSPMTSEEEDQRADTFSFHFSFVLSFVRTFFISFVISLVCIISHWDRHARRAKRSLQHAATRGQRTGYLPG